MLTNLSAQSLPVIFLNLLYLVIVLVSNLIEESDKNKSENSKKKKQQQKNCMFFFSFQVWELPALRETTFICLN